MRNPPPEVVASWPKPNYVDPEYHGHQLTIIGIVFLSVAVITVALRFYVRLWMKKSPGWDDLFMLIDIILIAGSTIASILGTVYYGWGYHIWDIPSRKLKALAIDNWVSQMLFVLIMSFNHLSILASYLRIGNTKGFRFLTWAMIAFTVCWCFAFIMVGVFSCVPLRHEWGPEYPQGCISEAGRMMTATILGIFQDVVVLVLPMPTLLRLKLPKRERAVLVMLMSVGVVACAATIVRTYFMWRCVVESWDISWWGYDCWLWNIVEINLSAICASVPTLRPLSHHIFPRGMVTKRSERSNPYDLSNMYESQQKKQGYGVSDIHQMTTIQVEEECGSHESTEELRLKAAYPSLYS